MSIDKLSVSENNLLNFVAWCYHFTHLNSDLASKAVTATISFHKDNGISFIRKNYPSIQRHIIGYRSLKPPKRRPKLPFLEYHIQKVFLHCVNTDNYDDVLPSAAVLLGYVLLLLKTVRGRIQSRYKRKELIKPIH